MAPGYHPTTANLVQILRTSTLFFLFLFFSFFSGFSNTYQSMCISRLRFMFLIFIFFVLFGSLFFSFFLCEPHAFIMLRQKRSSPETTPVVGGRLGLISFLVVQTPFTVWRRFRASSITDIKTRQTFFVMRFICSGQESHITFAYTFIA